MGEMIGSSNTQIWHMHQISNQIRDVSDHTAAELADLTRDMQSVRKSIDYLEHQTSLTKDSVDQISRATELIAAIASQTSLLSLNASIESARAGEFGKGFGVVAAEIQKLSVQANTAVDDIRSMVDSLIDNSSQAMERMTEVQTVILNQEQNIQKTEQVFENVKDGIRTSTEHMDIVIEKTDEMEEVRSKCCRSRTGKCCQCRRNNCLCRKCIPGASNNHHQDKRIGELSSEMKQSIEIFKIA